MFRIVSALCTLALLVVLAGCTVSPREKAFHTGVSALWPQIKEDWVPRVEQATDLTAESKDLRVGPSNSLASQMDELIQSEGQAINGKK